MKKHLWILAILSLIACKGKVEKNKEEGVVENRQKDQQLEKASSEKIQDSSLTAAIKKGQEVYVQNCVICHQTGGGGVPNMNPPLKATEYVLGEKKRIISIVLKGSSAGLEVNGDTFSNNMPAFAENLNNDQTANVLTYIRNSFGNKASMVTAEEVKVVRDSLK